MLRLPSEEVRESLGNPRVIGTCGCEVQEFSDKASHNQRFRREFANLNNLLNAPQRVSPRHQLEIRILVTFNV